MLETEAHRALRGNQSSQLDFVHFQLKTGGVKQPIEQPR